MADNTNADEEVQEDNLEERVEEPDTPDEPEENQEEETPEEPEEEAESEEPEEQEEQPKSRRLQKREEQLEEKLRVQELLEQLQQRPRQQQYPQGMNYAEQLEADPEVAQQLEADRQQYGQQLYNQGMQQAESVRWETRLEIDAPKVSSKHPELDATSDQFEPSVADALNTQYLHLVGYDQSTGMVQNPGIRYSDFVDAQYQLADRLAGQKVQRSTRNIAKQAAMTGLRPDGSSSKRLNLDQDFSTMSTEELKAYGASTGLATQKRTR